MAYSASDLQKIREAERRVYEAVFPALIIAVTLHVLFGRTDTLETPEDRGEWIDNRAKRSVNRWRRAFCPSRVGLPLESEWTEVTGENL